MGMALSKHWKLAEACGEGLHTCSIAGDMALAMLFCGVADRCVSVDVSLPDHTAQYEAQRCAGYFCHGPVS
jgi:hypothetical protein